MSDKGFKAVVIADTHLTTVNKYGRIEDGGINSRLQDNLQAIGKSVQHALNIKADYWIHLGDVYHSINPSEKLREMFFETIKPLMGRIPIIILVGNHDTNLRDTYSLMAEKKVINSIKAGVFHVINEPTAVKLKGVDCLFIPWAEEDKIEESLTEHTDCIVFGHMGIKGAQPSGTEFVLREGTTPARLTKHRMTFLGHYHKPQASSKWLYIGSSHKLDMGERDQEKRFMVLEADTKDINFEFESLDPRPFNWYIVEEGLALPEPKEGEIIKMTFRGSKSWVYSQNFKEIKKELVEKGAHKVIIDSEVIRDSITKGNQLQYQKETSWDTIIETFTKKKEAEEYASFGKKLFKEIIDEA